MPTIKSYPHYRINVEDRSIFEPVVLDVLPIHRPVYPMKTQKGPIGVPVWCPTIAEARKVFGAETFNVLNSDYYSQSSEFLNQTFISNGAFIVRLADSAATTAFSILEVSTVPVEVPQYDKDGFGNRVLDGNGDPIPSVDGDTNPIVETGLELVWTTRSVLANDEDFDNLQITTVDNAGDITTTYPIMAFKANSSGAWGNDSGYKIYFDIDDNEIDAVDRVDSIYINIAPIVKEFNASTVDPVRDKYSNVFNSFVFKPDTIDESVARRVSFKDVMEDAYDGDNPLPYTIDTYPDNIRILGESIAVVEVNRTAEITSGWLANPFSLRDLEAKPYDHVVFGAGGTVMSSDVVQYLSTGDDGDTSDTAIEALYRNFLELDINPDIVDRARFPFTHLIDTGWGIETKYAMCDFLAVRDDVKVVVSTQRCTDVDGLAVYNDAAEDESVGSALRGRALLIPESIIKGTEAFRAIIFTQAGKPHGLYNQMIPAGTYWYAIKLALHHNKSYMDGAPEGLPNSEVDQLKEFNWTPSAESQRERTWNTGLNYFQHYSMNELHYAALRSIYRYDTSVLTTDDFGNCLIYTMHEIRQSWAVFAGVTRSAGVLHDQIVEDLTIRLDRLVNGRYPFEVTAYQTKEEKQLGYQHHVRVSYTAPGQNRVWDVDIICNRENFTQA